MENMFCYTKRQSKILKIVNRKKITIKAISNLNNQPF